MSKVLASGLVKKSTSYNLDPAKLTLREGNTRFDHGDIASLAQSIKTECTRDPSNGGLLNDIRVKRLLPSDPRAKTYDFEIVDGERRFVAIQTLIAEGFSFPHGIGAKIVDRAQSDLDSLIQMYTANTGKPFLPLEEAAAFKRMRDAGMTVLQVAAAVGKGDVHITDTTALLNVDESIKEALISGEIGTTAAKVIATVAKGDKASQLEMVAIAKKAQGNTKSAKTARAALLAKATALKDARRKAKGKAVVMRSLNDEQLSVIGHDVAQGFLRKMKEAFPLQYPKGKVAEAVIVDAFRLVVKGDERLAAAYALGALQALLVAAGQKIDLDI